jgi:hypothetical protein
MSDDNRRVEVNSDYFFFLFLSLNAYYTNGDVDLLSIFLKNII